MLIEKSFKRLLFLLPKASTKPFPFAEEGLGEVIWIMKKALDCELVVCRITS